MVHPFWLANAITSAGEDRNRSCWAEAIGSEVYEVRNEREISDLWRKYEETGLKGSVGVGQGPNEGELGRAGRQASQGRSRSGFHPSFPPGPVTPTLSTGTMPTKLKDETVD